MEQLTLTQGEIEDLAQTLKFDKSVLRFTNLANKRAVAKRCREIGVKTFSRTAHGSLLDPRATVEGRLNPDQGLNNDYKHWTPKLYILESDHIYLNRG